MVTYEQIPLVRVHIKRALDRGDIDEQTYCKLIQSLNELETRNREKEKINQERMITTLNRALSYT